MNKKNIYLLAAFLFVFLTTGQPVYSQEQPAAKEKMVLLRLPTLVVDQDTFETLFEGVALIIPGAQSPAIVAIKDIQLFDDQCDRENLIDDLFYTQIEDYEKEHLFFVDYGDEVPPLAVVFLKKWERGKIESDRKNAPEVGYIQETDAHGNAHKNYRYGNDMLGFVASGLPQFTHHDPLGSVTAVTNAAGTTLETREYQPFGKSKATITDDIVLPNVELHFAGEIAPEVLGDLVDSDIPTTRTLEIFSPDDLVMGDIWLPDIYLTIGIDEPDKPYITVPVTQLPIIMVNDLSPPYLTMEVDENYLDPTDVIDTLNYTITLDLGDPVQPLTNALVVTQLPLNLTITGSSHSYTEQDNLIIWSLGDLTQQFTQITLTVSVDFTQNTNVIITPYAQLAADELTDPVYSNQAPTEIMSEGLAFFAQAYIHGTNTPTAYAKLFDPLYTTDFLCTIIYKGETSKNKRSFIQKETDNSTGLSYFGARYLDPTTGRFTAADPSLGDIQNPGSLHRYGYGYNNPLRYVDPFGLSVLDEEIDDQIKDIQKSKKYIIENAVRISAGALNVGDFYYEVFPGVGPVYCVFEGYVEEGHAAALDITARELKAGAAILTGSYIFYKVAHRLARFKRLDEDDYLSKTWKWIRSFSKKEKKTVNVKKPVKSHSELMTEADDILLPHASTKTRKEFTTKSNWKRPKGWRLPKNGTWTGVKGDSYFIPQNPTILGLNTGEGIPFKKGLADFRKWSKNLRIPGLTGFHGPDRTTVLNTLAKRKKTTAAKIEEWLQEKDLIIHHFKGSQIQLVPGRLHRGLRHHGWAAVMRSGS
ncbi:RHS repeat-associated core domain-containing protein [candidate division CSSED10-310 bacterium]|uniref:RHS repeat-associated core domain-containing protein n=1 Tax=candidate division CSSED10-310 bacterium TaxID=2855610 RepID=A0ABV6Z241_UNCC1